MLLSGKLPRAVAGRRTKWLVLVGWLVLLTVAVPLAGRLSGVESSDTTAELPRGADSTQVARLADRFPGGDVQAGLLVYARDGALTPADLERVDADRTAFAAYAAGPIAEPARSADGHALLLSVPFVKDHVAVDAKKVRDAAEANPPPGLTVRMTGPAGAALDAGDAFKGLGSTMLIATALLVAFFLLITYRSPVLWLLPLLNVAVALQVGNAAVYLLTRFAGLTVGSGLGTIVTVLIFGLGTDYAMLLLARYREELRGHEDRHEAMVIALGRAAPAITASAATVSLGLLCLLVATMGFNHTLGPVGAVAVLAGLATMTTLLPALLVVFGRWVFWPRIPRFGDAEPGTRWASLAAAVARRPRVTWIGAAVVLAALAAGVVGMRTGLDDKHMITGRPSSVVGQDLLAAHYPAGRSRPLRVVTSPGQADPARRALVATHGVASVGAAQASSDGHLRALPVVLTSPDKKLVPGVRDAVRPMHALVGGGIAATADRDAAQAHDRRMVIPLVLGVILVVLLLLLRSVLAPVLLMITVVGSYGAALGAARLLFEHAFGFQAADVQLVLVGFLFLVALGVDYNIFLLSRIREEAVRHGHRSGVARGLATTGGVITSAGAVLAATFAALAILPIVYLAEIGVLVAVGVLLDTLLVRSVLVPALTLDVGPRFWWPYRPPSSPGPVSAELVGTRNLRE